MKRFFYQYLCLLYSLVQAFMSLAMIVAIVKEAKFASEGDGASNLITIAIICLVVWFVMAMLDKALRKLDNFNFFTDCLLLLLISPIRFIFQIITIVRVHIAHYCGNDQYGKRGNDHYYFSGYIHYYLFNADHTDFRSPQNKVIESDRSRKKREDKQRVYNEIVGKHKSEAEATKTFFHNSKRSDGKYNVYIVPLCAIDENKFSTFAIKNANTRTGQLQIDELSIDEHKIINNVGIDGPFALSLRPGTYNFRVRVTGYVTSFPHNHREQIKETFTLKVYVGDSNVYLCLSMIFGTVTMQYTQKYTGKVVKEEFHHLEQKRRFGTVSRDTLNAVCSYWSNGVTNISVILDPYNN